MENTTARVFNGITVPDGEKITFKDGRPVTPARPIIPFIEGDGIGADIWPATRKVIDAAVLSAYGDSRSIAWLETFAGDNARTRFGQSLPADTLAAIKEFGVAIKGPLGTPTGGGIRSLNVTLRQTFDLYQCVRPVRYFLGVPSVVVAPEKLNVVIFRENTEDVYAGIEYPMASDQAKKLIEILGGFGATVRDDTGIGIKVISKHGSRRLVRRAIQFAIESGRKVVTLVHKGNIQKFTEGAFRDWGFELAREEFSDRIVFEDELWAQHGGKLPEGKILLNDRIADAMFFEVLTKPT
jgi:isocitrate dehydrogenase